MSALASIAPINSTSLVDEALSTIVRAITTGAFAPGEKLSEASLARQLGISRGPLREALGQLEGCLVNRTPRLGYSVIQLTAADLADLLAMREALEGMAARLAAARATDAELDRFRALLRDADVRSQRRDGYLRRALDDDFHLLMLDACGNARIAASLRWAVYYPLQLYRFSGAARLGGAKAALDEHARIVDALAARNGDAAEARMREHVSRAAVCYQPARAEREFGHAPERTSRRSAA